jgi:phosphoenolpyruvate synthase/pyruvate phosphate dikinase
VLALSKAEFPLKFFIRHEFLWVNTHLNPFKVLATEGGEAFEKRLYEYLRPFAAEMEKRHNLHFRSLDARANEFEYLKASPLHHVSEHGLALTLQFPRLLQAEINVCGRIAKEFGLKVTYSFPYVGTLEQLNRGLEIVRDGRGDVSMGVFVETPAFAESIQANLPRNLEFFIGTKDLASLFFGYSRGVGYSDRVNPLDDSNFKKLINKIVALVSDTDQVIYYFCFLEHFEESIAVLPESVGISVCAYEFAQLSGIQLPSLYNDGM